MKNEIVFIVEDEEVIASMIQRDLVKLGYTVPYVFSRGEDLLKTLDIFKPDLILMDITLKGELDGIQTVGFVLEKYSIPIIYLTAHADISIIKRAKITEPYGYILKPYEPRVLQICVEMSLYKFNIDRERRELLEKYEKALDKIKKLSGLIPICAKCKKIRDDQGYWKQVEDFIKEHSIDVEFTHGICPHCMKDLYPDMDI